MSEADLGSRVEGWARREDHVVLLVAIGSRVRAAGTRASADGGSDWDYQLATTQPRVLEVPAWLKSLGVEVLAYSVRMGRLGSSLKVSAVTNRGELDLVILPAEGMAAAAEAMKGPPVAWPPPLRAALTDLATVLAGGCLVLKDTAGLGPLVERVAREIPVARLDDAKVRLEAEGFVCDYVSTWRKLERGEWVAAQRWLHHQLVESNLRLLHELRLRGGSLSFPDGRRLERLDEELAGEVAVSATPDAEGLRAALLRCADLHRRLVGRLLGDAWTWPDLRSLRLGGE